MTVDQIVFALDVLALIGAVIVLLCAVFD